MGYGIPSRRRDADLGGAGGLWRVVNALYAQLADPIFPKHLRGPMPSSRATRPARPHPPRLSLVTGEADTKPSSAQVSRPPLPSSAISEAMPQRVYARLRSTRADQRAETALRWIQAHGGACTVRDLQRHRVAGVTRASQAEKLLRDLVDFGQGELRERRLPSGRTQRVFVMHRLIHRQRSRASSDQV